MLRTCMCMFVCIYVRARTQFLYLRLSAPRNYQGRPSPRQFVKAVIIPADLWHCIHIGRCLPPDQITSPAALDRPRARSLLGTIAGPSENHPFRVRGTIIGSVFDARFKLKPISTRMYPVCDTRRIYKYCLSFTLSPKVCVRGTFRSHLCDRRTT